MINATFLRINNLLLSTNYLLINQTLSNILYDDLSVHLLYIT